MYSLLGFLLWGFYCGNRYGLCSVCFVGEHLLFFYLYVNVVVAFIVIALCLVQVLFQVVFRF